jgi:hypothetical protein
LKPCPSSVLRQHNVKFQGATCTECCYPSVSLGATCTECCYPSISLGATCNEYCYPSVSLGATCTECCYPRVSLGATCTECCYPSLSFSPSPHLYTAACLIAFAGLPDPNITKLPLMWGTGCFTVSFRPLCFSPFSQGPIKSVTKFQFRNCGTRYLRNVAYSKLQYKFCVKFSFIYRSHVINI